MNNSIYRKDNPTTKDVLAILLLFVGFTASVILFLSWIIMLLLGTLATYFEFTPPGFWVAFAGVFLFNLVVFLFNFVKSGGRNT